MPKDKNIVADIIDIGDDITTKQSRIRIGKDNDLNLYHYQANSYILNNTGNLVIENKNETGKVQIKLGTTSDATDFQIVKSDGTEIFNVDGSGDVSIPGNLTTGTHVDNSTIEDLIIELGNGRTGDPSDDDPAQNPVGDCGIVMIRGDTGNDNAFMGFDDSENKFIMGTGTFTGATSGNLTITPGTLQVAGIEGPTALTLTSTSGPMTINSAGQTIDVDCAVIDIDTTNDISLDAGAASNFTTTAGALTLNGADGVNIQGNASEIDVTTTGALDLNSGAFTLNCSTSTITCSDTTSLSMVTNSAAAKTLTIDASNSGAGTASINIGTTESTAISIGHTSSETTVNDNLNVTGNLDVTGATSLATGGGVVNIASTGVMTTVKGTLNVDEAVTLDSTLDVTGDSVTFSSTNANDPLFTIKNTTDDTDGSRLRFVKDKGSAGADHDVCGIIEFYGDDANQNNVVFGQITGKVADATNVGGKIYLSIPTQNGGFQTGIVLKDKDASDEIYRPLFSTASTEVIMEGGITAGPSTMTSTLDVRSTATFEGGIFLDGNAGIIQSDRNGEFVALKLINQSDANDTTGIVSLQFDLEDTSGNTVDSGKIAIKKNETFTSTATTQDSNMVFSTSLNGTLTENMTLSSEGNINLIGSLTANSGIESKNGASGSGFIDLYEDSDNGTNKIRIIAPSAVTSDITLTLPDGDGDADQVLTTNGSGTLSWATASSNIDELTDGKSGGAEFTNSMILGHETTGTLNAAERNTAVGIASMDAITSGDDNVCFGHDAGGLIDSGSQNTCIGSSAGDALTTGSNNTIIGYNAAASAADVTNEITLGNGHIDTIRSGATTIASLSDRRDKTNIVNSNYGLNFIEKLRPVEFTWKRRILNKSDENNSHNGKNRLGFIAQEIQEAMPNNENDILDLVYESNPERLEVKQGNLVPILVKAIQELQAQVKTLQSAIKN